MLTIMARVVASLAVVVSSASFVSSALAATDHTPSLSRVQGVWVMQLYGSRVEMARQHGAFSKDLLTDSAMPFFAHKISNAINQSYLVKDFPALGPIAREAIQLWVTDSLRSKLPEEDRAEYEAFSKASGFGLRDTLNAAVVPDVGQWLTSSIFGGNKPTFGCSSVIFADGPQGFLHARNLDYEGYGIFDRQPLVIYFHPDAPGAQDYMSVTSMGLHTAGITASNTSGITIDLHQSLVGAVSREGTPILSITSRVVREARTLHDAIVILRQARYAGSWLVTVSSSKERRAAVVEVSADGAAVRLMSGTHLAVTNHALTPWMARKEFSVDYGFYNSSRERLAALERATAEADSADAADAAGRGTQATPQLAIDMIGSAPVALQTNIQSVVFAPERNLVYVATEPRLRARPVDGIYVPLPLNGRFNSRTTLPTPLTRSKPLTSDEIEATALLREAAQISTEEGRYEEAAALLEKAAVRDARNPSYPLLAALTLTRLAAEKNADDQALFARATALFDEAAGRGLPHYQTSLVHLMKGRMHDANHARDAALAEYNLVDQTLWRPLKRAARAGLSHRYGLRELRKIVVDYERDDLFRF